MVKPYANNEQNCDNFFKRTSLLCSFKARPFISFVSLKPKDTVGLEHDIDFNGPITKHW
jgi:hypothetical protein